MVQSGLCRCAAEPYLQALERNTCPSRHFAKHDGLIAMGSALDSLVAWVLRTLLMSHFVGIVSCFLVSGGTRSPPSPCLPPRGERPHGLSQLTTNTGSYTPMKRNQHRLEAKKGKGSSAGRPTLDDVERLSRGQAAKKRGTGSRAVCHRLNELERKVQRSIRQGVPSNFVLPSFHAGEIERK